MADKRMQLHWYGHPVENEEHASNLDLKAAVYQYHHGMPRHEAENRVKHEDRVERHQNAAAHHLDGMKAAHAVGNHEDAQQHHSMYTLHTKALGLDPGGAVAPEVAKWQGKGAKKHAYTFKGHGDDQFLTEPVNMSPAPLGKSEESTPDATCENCGNKRSPIEVKNDYCSGCAKEIDEAAAQGQANMHWGTGAKPSFGEAGPSAKNKLVDYLKGLGIEGATIEEPPKPGSREHLSNLWGELESGKHTGPVTTARFAPGHPLASQSVSLAADNSTPTLSAPKFGHLRIVKAEMWPFILGCWRTLAKADPAQAQGRVKQFDVRRTWLRHKHLPEEKAFDYSSWLTPGQHQNRYRMFVLSHGNGNPVRVHVVHGQQKAGTASGNVDQGDLEVENYNLAHAAHHDRGLEASMLNAMMGHAKSNMGADYLSHGPFTPEASGFIEAMAKPHGFQLGEPEDIDEGETPADQKPATLVSGGIKVRSNQPNRVPRSFQPKMHHWWKTGAEEGD
jgi:hypothetical protein